MKKTISLVLAVLFLLTVTSIATAEGSEVTLLGVINTEGNAYDDALIDAVARYEEQSGNTVDRQYFPDQTAYQEKVYTLAAADELADVFYLKGSWMTEFVENEWVADISEVLEANPEFVAKYNDGAFANFIRDGKTYGVPTESMVTSIVFYNKALWQKAGYDEFPKTWDELIEAAPKFEEMGITEFVLGNKANWPAESCWFSTIGNFGTGPDWTDAILAKDGSASYEDPGMIEALGKFQELAMTPGALNADVNSMDENQAREVFFNQQAATIVEGTWFISQIEMTQPEFIDDIELTILPSWEGAKGAANEVSGGPAWAFAISKKAMDDDARRQNAIDLILELMGEKSVAQALEGGIIMASSVEFDDSKLGPILLKYLDMMGDKSTVPIYDACMESGVVETFNVGLQELLINAKTPEELAAETQMEYEMATIG